MKEFLFLYRYAKQYAKTFIIMGIVSNLISILSLIYPFILSFLIDKVFIDHRFSDFTYVVAAYLSIFCLEQLLHLAEYRLWAHHYYRFLYDLRSAVFSKILSLNPKILNNMSAGECNVLLQDDTESCYSLVNWFVNDFTMNVIRYFLHFVCLCIINWKLSLILFIMVPVLAFISKITEMIIRKYADTWLRYAAVNRI